MSGPLTVDRLPGLLASLAELVRQEVLVGVPDSTADRERDDGEPVTNATIAYVHDNGEPELNIPARPFMDPGIRAAEDPICRRLKSAADATLAGNKARADQQLAAAGMAAQSSIRSKINDGPPPPLAPSTIANRHKQRGTKSMRPSEKAYLKMVAAGADPGAAQDAAGIKALVNTGQLRNSINYVIRRRR